MQQYWWWAIGITIAILLLGLAGFLLWWFLFRKKVTTGSSNSNQCPQCTCEKCATLQCQPQLQTPLSYAWYMDSNGFLYTTDSKGRNWYLTDTGDSHIYLDVLQNLKSNPVYLFKYDNTKSNSNVSYPRIPRYKSTDGGTTFIADGNYLALNGDVNQFYTKTATSNDSTTNWYYDNTTKQLLSLWSGSLNYGIPNATINLQCISATMGSPSTNSYVGQGPCPIQNTYVNNSTLITGPN